MAQYSLLLTIHIFFLLTVTNTVITDESVNDSAAVTLDTSASPTDSPSSILLPAFITTSYDDFSSTLLPDGQTSSQSSSMPSQPSSSFFPLPTDPSETFPGQLLGGPEDTNDFRLAIAVTYLMIILSALLGLSSFVSRDTTDVQQFTELLVVIYFIIECEEHIFNPLTLHLSCFIELFLNVNCDPTNRTLLDAARNGNGHGSSGSYIREFRSFFRRSSGFSIRSFNLRNFGRSGNANNRRWRVNNGFVSEYSLQVYALTKIFQVSDNRIAKNFLSSSFCLHHLLSVPFSPLSTKKDYIPVEWVTTSGLPSIKNVNPPPPSPCYHQDERPSSPLTLQLQDGGNGGGAGVGNFESIQHPREVHIDNRHSYRDQKKFNSLHLDSHSRHQHESQLLGSSPHNRRNSQKLLIQEVVINILNNGNNVNPGCVNFNNIENSHGNNGNANGGDVGRNSNISTDTANRNTAYESFLSLSIDTSEMTIFDYKISELTKFNDGDDLEVENLETRDEHEGEEWKDVMEEL
ncbi:1880_t:CDS:2 [Acaulospora colombiana]|uniref:1880_t:CDS:1 n=1 Tax=Acaulospora colombiana TaxID=27376 RepID=A0ACA9MNB0_9GLOM|nr:1880_t:CDS:2 [Acaulospora colombiana]